MQEETKARVGQGRTCIKQPNPIIWNNHFEEHNDKNT